MIIKIFVKFSFYYDTFENQHLSTKKYAKYFYYKYNTNYRYTCRSKNSKM